MSSALRLASKRQSWRATLRRVNRPRRTGRQRSRESSIRWWPGAIRGSSNRRGNSGVYIRVPEDGKHHGEGAGIEVQVLDDSAERYRQIKPWQYTGSLYAIAPATIHVGKPAGEWNTLEINCRGKAYHVFHNGTL